MRKFFFTIATVVLVSKIFAAEPELKGSAAELTAYLAGLPKMVSVAGESEVKVAADRAVVSLKVTTEQKSLQETLRANQDARGKIISMLKERGLAADKIQSSRFSSTTKTGVFSDKAKSYRVENFLKVKVQDEKEFQAVAHVVDVMPEVQYVGVDFEQSDKETLKNKALALALDNASERKRVFEEHLGVKLVPKSFSQPALSEPWARRRNYEATEKYPASALSRVTPLPSADSGAVIEESGSLFGELVFTAHVTVDYAVETK